MAGTQKDMAGTQKDMAGNAKDMAGNAKDLAGTSRHLLPSFIYRGERPATDATIEEARNQRDDDNDCRRN